MPDEQAEQTAVVTSGAVEPADGASPEDVAVPAGDAVAADDGAVADEPVEFDLSTDDGIKAAIDAVPNLKGYLEKTKADAANAARQRFESEQLRDRGSNERAQQAVSYIAAQLQAGREPDELAKEVAPWVKAHEAMTRLELLKAMLGQAAANGDETAEQLAESLKGSADEWVPVAQRAVDAAVRRAKEAGIEEGRRNSSEEYAARLEADRKARELEESTAGKTNPPAVSGTSPGGGPTAPATARLEAMSSAAFAALSKDEQQSLIRQAREEASRTPVGAR